MFDVSLSKKYNSIYLDKFIDLYRCVILYCSVEYLYVDIDGRIKEADGLP